MLDTTDPGPWLSRDELEAQGATLRHAGKQTDDDVLAFANAMHEANPWIVSDLLYFLEKPWKWDDEYALWIRSGRPRYDGEPGFNAFVSGLELLLAKR